jgi:N-methylhydantoinase B
MEALLERTAMSAFIREKKDFYTALFDADGAMAVGSNLPIFGDIVAPVVREYPAETMRRGDLYWYSDCYGSGGAVSHSNDQVFLAPVYHDERRVAFVMGWAHFSDIGGLRPGSISPDATDHFQEGIVIPPVRLQRDGATNEELLRTFWRNSRFPAWSKGDTRALMAAVRLGERRMEEIAGRFGADVLADAFRQLLERTERTVRQKLLAAFPRGTTRFADTIDSDGHGRGPLTMRFALTRSDNDRLVLDATESDDQTPGPVNYLMHPDVPGTALGLYMLQDEPSGVLNAGACRAIDEILLREGSLLQPKSPAPLGMRGLTMMRVLAALNGLVAVATGGKAPAAHSAYVIALLRGEWRGKPFLFNDGLGVGYGARPFADGSDAVYFVAQENYPVEFTELSYPVRFRGYGIHRDSGGAGRYRGGCGITREYEVLAERSVLAIRVDGVVNPPWGAAGGRAGGSGRVVLNPGTDRERVLPPLSDGNVVLKGDVIRFETGGGGGWGHPYDRPPDRVLHDVLCGFVSVEAAEGLYGVVVRDGALDAARTAQRRADRPEAGLFHRREYGDAVV